MNHLRLSSLFVFTVCALVVVTMALPVYRAYAPAIKAPSARPPKPPLTTEPRPGEPECRARLVALANDFREFLQQHDRMPWHPGELSTPSVCPASGLKYTWTMVKVTPRTREALIRWGKEGFFDEYQELVKSFDWDTNPIARCPYHLNMAAIGDWMWVDGEVALDDTTFQEGGWIPIAGPGWESLGLVLGVTLTGRVGYDVGPEGTGYADHEIYESIMRLLDKWGWWQCF
jgi:hypothetical protein